MAHLLFEGPHLLLEGHDPTPGRRQLHLGLKSGVDDALSGMRKGGSTTRGSRHAAALGNHIIMRTIPPHLGLPDLILRHVQVPIQQRLPFPSCPLHLHSRRLLFCHRWACRPTDGLPARGNTTRPDIRG